MYLPDTNLMTLQMISINKQCNTLNINSLVFFLGGGIAQLINHSTYFDFAQHKYS